jgi:hypothetical protein
MQAGAAGLTFAGRKDNLAVDREQPRPKPYRFYQSRNKVVLYVGAGGGQLLDTSADFSKLIAVDQNQDSLNHHNFDLRRSKAHDSVQIITSPFEEITA